MELTENSLTSVVDEDASHAKSNIIIKIINLAFNLISLLPPCVHSSVVTDKCLMALDLKAPAIIAIRFFLLVYITYHHSHDEVSFNLGRNYK
jgi:hypothetical protein